jgi:hypothetical protein
LTPNQRTFTLGHLPAEDAAMEVVDAKHQAKAILKEIMDQHPGDPDLMATWDVWFERMADGVSGVGELSRCATLALLVY